MVLHGSVFPLDHSDPMWAKIDSRKKKSKAWSIKHQKQGCFRNRGVVFLGLLATQVETW